MTTYYELLDNMLKVTGNNGDVVQLRDLNGKSWVLPAAVVDTLPKVVGPKEGSVWRNTNSGDVFIYHERNLHNPKLIVNLRFFLKNPQLWEEYGKPAEDDFADRVQALMEDGSDPSLTFTKNNDGSINAEYCSDNRAYSWEQSEYGSGSDIEEAINDLRPYMSADGTQVHP